MRTLYQATVYGRTITAVEPNAVVNLARMLCQDLGRALPGLRIKPVRS